MAIVVPGALRAARLTGQRLTIQVVGISVPVLGVARMAWSDG